ncbi:flagellar accessory protein FlaH [archaeon]|nr:flagellar accessory protein FlaH [archaeon]
MEGTTKGDITSFELGNPALDKRIGGIPIPSLMLLEGPNDSGKSVIAQQITYGALKSKNKLLYITTEETSKGLINNMERLKWSVTEAFIYGRLKVTSLTTSSMNWDQEISKYYLIALINYIKQKCDQYNIVVIDSITHLLTHAADTDILDFFTQCRYLVDTIGQTFIFTMHPYALKQELLIRVRSFCDGHIHLDIKNIRDINALTMNVAKLKGASKTVNEVITFEVSPVYGIKILPFSSARG